MRWCATVEGFEVGRGRRGAVEWREEVGSLGFGVGSVEKRMTWWKKRERPRSQTEGREEEPV